MELGSVRTRGPVEAIGEGAFERACVERVFFKTLSDKFWVWSWVV